MCKDTRHIGGAQLMETIKKSQRIVVTREGEKKKIVFMGQGHIHIFLPNLWMGSRDIKKSLTKELEG